MWRRLRVSYKGRVRVVKVPVEVAGDSAVLVSVVLDAVELPRGSEIQLTTTSGASVEFDENLQEQQTYQVRLVASNEGAFRATAGAGIVQILSGGREGMGKVESAPAVMRDLVMHSVLFASQAERSGYVPVAGYDNTLELEAPPPGIGAVKEQSQTHFEAEFCGLSYQHQLTKFNRILAHLVNERTVLAWLRTNLAFITLSFKYMKLANAFEDMRDTTASIMLLVCGGVFMVLLPVSWWSGYHRYAKCKELLDYDITRISAYLHKMGFDLDTSVFFLLVSLSFVTICYSSTIIIWTSQVEQDDGVVSNDIVSN